MVEQVVKDGLKEYAATDGKSWEEEMERDDRLKTLKEQEEKARSKGEEGQKEEMDESSVETVRACKRPWWVVQPYVRPLPKEALAKGSLTLSKKERAALEKGSETHKPGPAKVEVVPSEYVELDKAGGERKGEEVEIPKEGLVCG
jgi:tRNA-dihydrouridine synthase 1